MQFVIVASCDILLLSSSRLPPNRVCRSYPMCAYSRRPASDLLSEANRSHAKSEMCPSYVFCRAYDFSSHLCPVDARVHCLVHLPCYYNVVAAYHVKSMWCLHALFFVVLWSNDALNCVLQDEVCDLIASNQCADKRTAVHCDDADLLCT